MGSWLTREQSVANNDPPPEESRQESESESVGDLQTRMRLEVTRMERHLRELRRLRDLMDPDTDEDDGDEGTLHPKLQQLQERQQQLNPNTKEKCYDPSDSSLKFVDKEDEHDFLCEGYSSRRALMSCGHTVTPPSLFYWCQIQLDQGTTAFECGVCKAVWPFEEVRTMALLTDEEKDVFDDALFHNVDRKNLKTQKCPGCKSRVMREDPNNLRVRCSQCTVKKGRIYEFCWQCRKKWRGLSNCGNEGCENVDLKTLRTCSEIEFKDVEGVKGCPSVRACPTCGRLLAHNSEKCKNVICPDCKVEFCFVCLKITKECLKTSSHYRTCSSGVAPRQTSIPVKK